MQEQSETDPDAFKTFTQAAGQEPAGIARQAQHSPWLTENKGALDEYNRRIESRGVFSDGLRRF